MAPMADVIDSDEEAPPPPPPTSSTGASGEKEEGSSGKKREREGESDEEAAVGNGRDDEDLVDSDADANAEAEADADAESSDGGARKKKKKKKKMKRSESDEEERAARKERKRAKLEAKKAKKLKKQMKRIADAEDPFDSDEEADEEEEEEDDDDDAGASEEEEQEDRRARKKSKSSSRSSKTDKKSKFDVRNFFADDVEEGDDDEDEGDYEAAGEIEYDAAEAAAVDAVERRQALQREADSRSINDIADDIINRYKGGARAQRVAAQYGSGQGVYRSGALSQTTALPTGRDPHLWRLRVRIGQEDLAVRSVLLKQFAMKQANPAHIGIHSAFSTASKGYLYVEAVAEPLVRQAIAGLRAILQFSTQKKMLKEGQWCRMRRGPIKGDLVKVLKVLEGGVKALIQGVPRLDYSVRDRKGRGNTARPVQALFSTEECNNLEGSDGFKSYTMGRQPTLNERMYSFQGEYYKNGFLIKEVIVETYLNPNNVQPRLEELALFRASKATEEEEEDMAEESESDGDGGRVLRARGAKSHVSTAAGMMRDLVDVAGDEAIMDEAHKSATLPFVVGDIVQVQAGELKNLTGVVVSIDEANELIQMEPAVTGGVALGMQTIEASLLVKYITPGAHVKIKQGQYMGQTGRVVGIVRQGSEGNMASEYTTVAYILTDGVNTEISCNVDHLQTTTEVASALSSLQGYELYDLVVISQNESAVVTVVGSEYLTVINHQGEVKRVLPQELKGKRNQQSQRSATLDGSLSSVTCGDMVKVTEGAYKDRSGTVKHILKSILWLHSTSHLKDSGILVVRSRSCILSGNKARTALSASTVPGLAGGAQPVTGGGARASGGKFGARDDRVGKRVKITKGGHKGMLGTIVEVCDDKFFKVELLAKMVTKSIEQTKCKMVDDMSAPNMRSTFHGAPPTPFLVGETPLHTGAETPMVSGNETPMVDGNETPMGDSGWGGSGSAYGSSAYDGPGQGQGQNPWEVGSSSGLGAGANSTDHSYAGSIATNNSSPYGAGSYSPSGASGASPNYSPHMTPGGEDGFSFHEWVENMVLVFADATAHPAARCVVRQVPDANSMCEVGLLEDGGATVGQTVHAHVADLSPFPHFKKGMTVRMVRGEYRGEESTIKVCVGRDLLLNATHIDGIQKASEAAVLWDGRAVF